MFPFYAILTLFVPSYEAQCIPNALLKCVFYVKEMFYIKMLERLIQIWC